MRFCQNEICRIARYRVNVFGRRYSIIRKFVNFHAIHTQYIFIQTGMQFQSERNIVLEMKPIGRFIPNAKIKFTKLKINNTENFIKQTSLKIRKFSWESSMVKLAFLLFLNPFAEKTFYLIIQKYLNLKFTFNATGFIHTVEFQQNRIILFIEKWNSSNFQVRKCSEWCVQFSVLYLHSPFHYSDVAFQL